MAECFAACIDQYTQRYGWKLLERGTFIERVERRLAAEGSSTHVCVLAVYSAALHDACSGAEGQARQNQGYTELMAFLDRVASRRYQAVRADATQCALEKIIRSFDRCRQPETFLAFALQKLRDAARAEFRQLQRDGAAVPLDPLEQVSTGQATLADTADQVLQSDFQRRLAACVGRSLALHPRAAAQIGTLWLTYIEGLDDQAIASRLGKTRAAVHVLRSRGLTRLRQDAALQQLGAELGLLGALGVPA